MDEFDTILASSLATLAAIGLECRSPHDDLYMLSNAHNSWCVGLARDLGQRLDAKGKGKRNPHDTSHSTRLDFNHTREHKCYFVLREYFPLLFSHALSH